MFLLILDSSAASPISREIPSKLEANVRRQIVNLPPMQPAEDRGIDAITPEPSVHCITMHG